MVRVHLHSRKVVAIQGTYASRHGPPFLRTTPGFGLALLRFVEPAPLVPTELLIDCEVHVDWGDEDGGGCDDDGSECGDGDGCCDRAGNEMMYSLVVRRDGREITRRRGMARDPGLRVSVRTALVWPPPRLIAELYWRDGSRHLHIVLPPPLSAFDLSGTLGLPSIAVANNDLLLDQGW